MSNDFYSIEINNNNNQLLTNLNYYLLSNNHFEGQNFVLDQCVLVQEKENMCLFFSKEDIQFSYEEGEIIVKYDRSRSPRNYMCSEVRFDRITICSNKSLEHLLNFTKMIDKIHVPDISDNHLTKYIWDKEGWRYNKHFKHRSLDTIYIPQKDKIVHTLDMFLNDSKKHELYSKLEIPAKKVFLFYGLPGSGKTSLIRALASHFKRNICVVKNVIDNDDNSLERILSNIKNNSFLVFEDIDCIYKKGGEMGSNSSMSYSGILNMLDGIAKYDNLAIFITTNRINTLDATFKRRVDLFVEFTYVQKAEILIMYNKFFESDTPEQSIKFYDSIKNKKLTTNMLEKFFVYCIENEYRPIEHLKYLEEYAEMSSDRNNQNLYL
jgi:chaperone BCS1